VRSRHIVVVDQDNHHRGVGVGVGTAGDVVGLDMCFAGVGAGVKCIRLEAREEVHSRQEDQGDPEEARNRQEEARNRQEAQEEVRTG
jgi:hypothetical protein